MQEVKGWVTEQDRDENHVCMNPIHRLTWIACHTPPNCDTGECPGALVGKRSIVVVESKLESSVKIVLFANNVGNAVRQEMDQSY